VALYSDGVSERVKVPAVDGWFTTPADGDAEQPHLIGAKCVQCGTYVFPPRASGCPNPRCTSDELAPTPLSRRGKVWSYTENQYAPPPPFRAPDPFEPYALAAVELEAEGLVVLGQVAKGVLAADLKVGMDMQVEIGTLYTDTDADGNPVDHLVYVWAPAAPEGSS
jgi:uncharacterized OB-fold protein